MASRIMHISICMEILKKLNFIDEERFIIGTLLPDAISRENVLHDEIYSKTHFKKVDEKTNSKYYDFSGFFSRYTDKILQDDLYLGYYLHILQDAIFRKFIYIDNHLIKQRKKLDFTEKLYADYDILNKYLIKKYDMNFDINTFDGVSYNGIDEIYNFDISVIKDGLKGDFENIEKCLHSKFSYLNESMILEYILKCMDICVNEILNIKNGKSTNLSVLDYSYDI